MDDHGRCVDCVAARHLGGKMDNDWYMDRIQNKCRYKYKYKYNYKYKYRYKYKLRTNTDTNTKTDKIHSLEKQLSQVGFYLHR